MRCFSVVVFCLTLAGCSTAPAPSSEKAATEVKQDELKKYDLHGEVLRLDKEGKTVVVKHQAIGDWMGAMTMEFPVKDPADFAKLQEGKPVEATVFVQGASYWVGDVKTEPAQK
ncbi:MAG: copper-binding protein [Acidobacteriota bacterium]